MKSVKILISMILIMIATTIATARPTNIEREKKMKRIISRIVDYPQKTIGQEKGNHTVAIDLTVFEDGRIQINKINGHPSFVKHVEKELKNCCIKPFQHLSGRYLYKLEFQS